MAVHAVMTVVRAFKAAGVGAAVVEGKLPSIVGDSVVVPDAGSFPRSLSVTINSAPFALDSVVLACLSEVRALSLADYKARCNEEKIQYLDFMKKRLFTSVVKGDSALAALEASMVDDQPPAAAAPPLTGVKRARGVADDEDAGATVAVDVLEADRSAKRQRLDAEGHALHVPLMSTFDPCAYLSRIVSKTGAEQLKAARELERPLRTRASVLTSKTMTGKTFDNVVKLLHNIKRARKADEARKDQTDKKGQQKAVYDRYNNGRTEQQIMKDDAGIDTAEFNIDTTGTYIPGAGGAAAAAPAAAANPAAAVAAAAAAAALGRTAAAAAAAAEPSARSRGGASAGGAAGGAPAVRMPIIVAPPGTSTTLVTSCNVAMFLEKGLWAAKEDVQAEYKVANPGRSFHPRLGLRHRIGEDAVPFRVVDNVLSLREDEWNDVVAIFVIGPAWQFKNFPAALRQPVDLFDRVRGYHVLFADETVAESVAKWNVLCVRIQRSGRHGDAAAVVNLWRDLDDFIRRKKPHLQYPAARREAL